MIPLYDDVILGIINSLNFFFTFQTIKEYSLRLSKLMSVFVVNFFHLKLQGWGSDILWTYEFGASFLLIGPHIEFLLVFCSSRFGINLKLACLYLLDKFVDGPTE